MNKYKAMTVLLECDKNNFECDINFLETVKERFLVEAAIDDSMCRVSVFFLCVILNYIVNNQNVTLKIQN